MWFGTYLFGTYLCFYIWQMLHHSFYIVNIVFLYSAYSVCANIAVYFLAGMFGLCLLPFYISLLNTPRAFSISTSSQVSMLRDRKALTPLKHAHTMSTGLYISLLLLRLCFTPHFYCFLFCWHLTPCFHQPLSGSKRLRCSLHRAMIHIVVSEACMLFHWCFCGLLLMSCCGLFSGFRTNFRSPRTPSKTVLICEDISEKSISWLDFMGLVECLLG